MQTDPRRLVERLAARLGAQLVETHISWVLLAGDLAYKLKKPLRLPFLDYSTPERRLHFCEEEVRLNQRLAPGLYLGVSRVTGSVDAPEFDGAGPALESAVRMRRFPPGALFSERAAAGTLTPALVDRLADRIARFHRDAPVRPAPAADLRRRADAALRGAGPLLESAQLQALRAWLAREADAVLPLWRERAGAGHVRECHGDLHLANILEQEGALAAFDCIEFDEGLRCIDVIEEVAFTLMDFVARGQAALGWRFLDGWLERTGEHEGLPGLRLCLVYRALVRALAEHLREPRGGAALGYARQALHWSAPTAPRLVITHGLPGSGKSFRSQRLLEREGAIRIRSDVERKRLHGLSPLDRSREHGVDIYTPEATRRTYARMNALARTCLGAGWPVVLDGAFLKREERLQARAVADALGVPFAILACEAPLPLLRERLFARVGDASEADARVLDLLRTGVDPLQGEELACVLPASG